MKRYLDLIPISARVHKKQSKMTRICIILAVFLVTAIFSMADMEIRSQYLQTIQSDGNWHAMFKGITEEQAESIAAAPEVEASSWYDVLNYGLDEAYEIDGNRVAICGFEEDFYELMPAAEIVEGESIANCAVLTLNAKEKLPIQIGDSVMLIMPDGRAQQLQISGFTKDTGMIMKDDAIGIFTDIPTIALLKGKADREDMAYYVQFSRNCNIPKVITRIENELGLTKEQVGRNEKLLGVMGMSRDSYILQLYGVAAVLAILVITAGVLMIAGNLNSNVAKRTEFFGMMRCQGATKVQIKRFVRLEALNWCKSAVPEGVAGGIVVTWILCNMLRLASPGYFSEMPALGVSTMGILFGVVIGVITVLIAASAPAKRAAAVSPLTAVSGNSYYSETGESTRNSSRKSKTKKKHAIKESKNARKTGEAETFKKRHIRISEFFHVETSLGIHHACGSKKNYFLMAGSFA
ncbi:MAG: ABC transporter permease, partial [bacterium]|nr:ABC transporter permease [bacterium]